MEFLKFKILEEAPGIVHFITIRQGGLSEGKYASLNLSLKVNDNPHHVHENLTRLADSIGIPLDHLVIPDQCHTSHIKEVREINLAIDVSDTDGLITKDKGICLFVLVADCVPVILYDPVQRAVAALHAGWRGTYKRIVCRGVERMVRTFGSRPENILAGIGPAISLEQYEVGSEVSGNFHLLFSDPPEVISKNPQTGKEHLDLKTANSILLQRSGLKKENIEISPLCTFSAPEIFFSARRDGIECGRFATGIMLV
jgi:YfiH family protein